MERKKDSVTFFGTVYDANGVHPDSKKVDTIHQMPSSGIPSQLQWFLGMVIYFSPFIPFIYTHCTTIGTVEKGFRVQVEHFLSSPLTGSRNWSARICLFTTSMYGSQSPSKWMHQERGCFSRKDAQLPLPPRLLHLQSNNMPT